MNSATVSRALSGKGPVAERTRERILRAADAIGYRPSAAARATRTGRTGMLGILQSTNPGSSVHAPQFEFGLSNSLWRRGLKLVREVMPEDAERPPEIVRERVVDGLILNFAYATPAHIRETLDRCGLPAVWVNRKLGRNCIYAADQGASYEATRHLFSFGHRRVALLSVSLDRTPRSLQDPHYSVTERCLGYEQAMREAGLSPEVHELPKPADERERRSGSLLKACLDYLKRPDRPTALLCNCDGRTVMLAAAMLGMRVPEDLSVMVFDNEVLSDELVAIDRMLVPYAHMGRAVVDELCALIEQPLQQRPAVVVPFVFYQANTIAPPRR